MYSLRSTCLAVPGHVRQGYPLFCYGYCFTGPLDSVPNYNGKPSSSFRVVDLDFDDVALFGDDSQVIQVALNQLVAEITMYDLNFSSSKYRTLLQNWHKDPPVLTLCGGNV